MRRNSYRVISPKPGKKWFSSYVRKVANTAANNSVSNTFNTWEKAQAMADTINIQNMNAEEAA